MRNFVLKLLICLCAHSLSGQEESLLSVPLMMRVEGQPRPSPARLSFRGRAFDASVAPAKESVRSSPDYVWFQKFLLDASGPNPEQAEKQILIESTATTQVTAKGLLSGYRSLLTAGPARILFSIRDSNRASNGNVFFWMTLPQNSGSARFAATMVTPRQASFVAAPPDSGDGRVYSILRSLDAQSKTRPPLEILASLQSPLAESGAILPIDAEWKLWVPEFQPTVATKLSCTPRPTEPTMFVGCWLKALFAGADQSAFMAAKSKASAAQWLSSLSQSERASLVKLHDLDSLSSSIIRLEDLYLVFPGFGSPALGNKSSFYVLRDNSGLKIVNFFSADFADGLFAKAVESVRSKPATKQ